MSPCEGRASHHRNIASSRYVNASECPGEPLNPRTMQRRDDVNPVFPHPTKPLSRDATKYHLCAQQPCSPLCPIYERS